MPQVWTPDDLRFADIRAAHSGSAEQVAADLLAAAGQPATRLQGVTARDQAVQTLERQSANRPAPGSVIVTDKGLSGQDTENFVAGEDLQLTLIRPPAKTRSSPARSRTGSASASRPSSGP